MSGQNLLTSNVSLVLTSASLSNGQGHGWREVLGLVLRCAARGVESVKVKTSGVYLTVLLSGRADPSQSRSEQELTVHNWKDGVKLVDTIVSASSSSHEVVCLT